MSYLIRVFLPILMTDIGSFSQFFPQFQGENSQIKEQKKKLYHILGHLNCTAPHQIVFLHSNFGYVLFSKQNNLFFGLLIILYGMFFPILS